MNQKKSVFIILLIVALVLGASAYFILKGMQEVDVEVSDTREEVVSDVKEEFTILEEDDTTPEEINNEAVKELDEIIDSIEGDSEDLSELEL